MVITPSAGFEELLLQLQLATCLDCGLISHYLKEKQLEQYRKRYAADFEAKQAGIDEV